MRSSAVIWSSRRGQVMHQSNINWHRARYESRYLKLKKRLPHSMHLQGTTVQHLSIHSRTPCVLERQTLVAPQNGHEEPPPRKTPWNDGRSGCTVRFSVDLMRSIKPP